MAIDWDGLVLAPVMGVFGEPVTYSPAVGAPFSVTGVFDEAFHEMEMTRDGPAITTEMPVLGIRLAEFTVAPVQGDQLTVRGMTFAVREVRLDGHGHAKLMLNYLSGP